MASRRQLKKSVKFITDELLTDCVALSLCQQGDDELLHALMVETLALRNDFVSRLSHTEPGNARGYYRNFKQEFTDKANDLSERIVKA